MKMGELKLDELTIVTRHHVIPTIRGRPYRNLMHCSTAAIRGGEQGAALMMTFDELWCTVSIDNHPERATISHDQSINDIVLRNTRSLMTGFQHPRQACSSS